MAWTNPLDKLPQVPQDYANHVIYGGVAYLALHIAISSYAALAAVFAVSAAKKAVDYFKEHESLTMCLGKTLISCIWPITLVLAR